ncbi:PIN domain-containing protein [Aurantimonas sp. 22II-16-19i]|uniref:PIN domain-containing protein n=1 Tax=Aurantimonas sp. 22II-16-19i TaxID=1317114 RepID=UPI0009F7CCDA|nr:PIN domain-containing protein [Aurantimonas sp. 22II-16-19i]ORE92709.1 twitching motility protein PilT [Aurantimonas sp. 22II-16-19i]
MIVLDTNVLSETMKPDPDPNVIAWLNRQSPSSLWLTTITVAELRYGAAKLPHGRRRMAFERMIEAYVSDAFRNRIATFDLPATTMFARRAADAARAGREVKGFADAAIAAIALAKGFSVATRDVRPFDDMGVAVVDPWLPL